MKSYEYDKLWSDWNDSSEGLGIIAGSANGASKFQVWRGEGTLSGYICVGGRKRDAVNHFASSVGSYLEDNAPTHPLNCLLIASPGWGKSYLAECLAKHFDMDYLPFSIAQMASTNDLMNCFATIASVQNRSKRKTAIFIDEVNAEIEGNSIMGQLLHPTWDGVFLINGKSFKIKPSVWIFASTDPIVRKNPKDSDFVSKNKGEDFISRLNGPILDLDNLGAGYNLAEIIKKVRGRLNTMVNITQDEYITKIYKEVENQEFKYFIKEDSQLKTEQVYLMVYLLDAKWGPINKVQRCVMQLFHDILPVNGYRSLEFFAMNFTEIEKGEINISNIPIVVENEELRRHIIMPEEWIELDRTKTYCNNEESCDHKPITIETRVK